MKKRRMRLTTATVDTAIGYATNPGGSGIVYARVRGVVGDQLLRVPFRVGRTSSLPDREAGYAALTAVARALHGWGVGRVRFALDDPALIDDLTAHRDLPPAIVLPYVRLRCALNQLDDVTFERATESDLAARARAEVTLTVAA
jgi:hypothetical protein